MNTKFKSLKKPIIVGFLSLAITLPAYADCSVCSLHYAIYNAANSVVAAINRIHARIEAIVDSNFAAQPGLEEAIKLNRELGALEEPIEKSQEQSAYQTILGAIGPLSDADKELKFDYIKNTLSSFKAGDLWSEELTGSSQDQHKYEAEQRCGSHRLTLNSLIGPLTYRKISMSCDAGSPTREDRDQAEYAKSFIQLVSDLGDPISDVNAKTAFRDENPDPKDIKNLQKSSSYKEYLVARRNWLSAWDVAYDSLTYLFTEHASPDGDKDSSTELAYKIATRRTSNPDGKWYSDMQGSIGPVLQREAVFILAEIQRDLNDLRREHQRLIAIQSAQLLQTLTQTKRLLQLKETNVKQQAQSISSKRSEKEARKRIGG